LRNLVETWAEYSLYFVTQSRYVRIRDHKQLHSGREFCFPGPLESWIRFSRASRIKTSAAHSPILMTTRSWLETALAMNIVVPSVEFESKHTTPLQHRRTFMAFKECLMRVFYERCEHDEILRWEWRQVHTNGSSGACSQYVSTKTARE